MKNACFAIIAVFFLFACFPAYAAESLSLDALIAEAKTNNPDILLAKKRWEASQARIPRKKAWDDPSIGVSFQRTPGSPFNLGRTPSEERMFSVSQTLPLFGKLSLKAKVAVIESQMLAAEYKAKELEVVNTLKDLYFDMALHHERIELARANLELLKGIADVAQARYSTGDVTQEEVLKIYLEIARLNTDINSMVQEISAAHTRINAILNKAPEDPVADPVLDTDTSFKKNIFSLYDMTIENDQELIEFSYAIEKSKVDKSLAKRSIFPDVLAQIAERGFSTGSIGPWDIGMAFTVPLWFWTKQRYEIKEAIANEEGAKAAYLGMKNKALAATKDIYSRVRSNKNKAETYKNSMIPLLESSINSSIAAFRSGKGDFMALLDTQRMLINTKTEYFAALVEYNKALADLERQTGYRPSKEVKNEKK